MRIGLFIGGIGLLLPASLGAQGAQPDTTRLPELTPRAVEVRGELRIELPSLARQPLTGFDLVPRRLQLDTVRGPWLEHLGLPWEIAAVSVQRPQPRPLRARLPEEPAWMRLQAGYGRFVSPELELELAPSGQIASALSGSFRYGHRSSQGHLERAAFRRDELGFVLFAFPRGSLLGSPWTAGVELGGSDYGYHLYGVPRIEVPRRLRTLQGRLQARSREARGPGFDMELVWRADRAHLDTLLDRPDWVADSAFRAPSSWRLGGSQARFAARIGHRGRTVALEMGLRYEHVRASRWIQEPERDASGWLAGIRLLGAYRITPAWEAELGLSWNRFRGLDDSLSGEQLSPYLRLSWRPGARIMLWARGQGDVELEAGPGSLLNRYPYVDPRGRQTVARIPLRVDVGLDVYLGGALRAHGRFLWARWRQWSYPELLAPGRFAIAHLPEVYQRYGELTLTLRPLSGPWAQLTGRYEWTRRGEGLSVPYLPRWHARAELGYAFPTGVVFSAQMRYEGARSGGRVELASPLQTSPLPEIRRSLAPYLRMDVRLLACLSRQAGIYVQLENLLNRTYYIWDFYPERPLDGRLGLWLRW